MRPLSAHKVNAAEVEGFNGVNPPESMRQEEQTLQPSVPQSFNGVNPPESMRPPPVNRKEFEQMSFNGVNPPESMRPILKQL